MFLIQYQKNKELKRYDFDSIEDLANQLGISKELAREITLDRQNALKYGFLLNREAKDEKADLPLFYQDTTTGEIYAKPVDIAKALGLDGRKVRRHLKSNLVVAGRPFKKDYFLNLIERHIFMSRKKELDGERWVDLGGYAKRYQVSNYGRLRSVGDKYTRLLTVFWKKGTAVYKLNTEENYFKLVTIDEIMKKELPKFRKEESKAC